jgi:hypothetical protein
MERFDRIIYSTVFSLHHIGEAAINCRPLLIPVKGAYPERGNDAVRGLHSGHFQGRLHPILGVNY